MRNIITEQAKIAKESQLHLTTEQKNSILESIKKHLHKHQQQIIASNQQDINIAKSNNLSEALIDRLTVNDTTIEAMCHSLDEIISLDDPCHKVLETIVHENKMLIKKVSVPIGVIAIIYESRPNVTLDAAALCIKSGNAIILKGGKEAIHTNRIIADCIKQALLDNINTSDMIQFIDSTERADTLELLQQQEFIDVIIPRGGTGLINFINDNTNIPVLKHLHGICHVYVACKADLDMACDIIVNAKCQRPGVCNAIETLVVNTKVAASLFQKLLPKLSAKGVELRLCPLSIEAISSDNSLAGIKYSEASQQDWSEEYLDLILSIKTVGSFEQAITHINHYGSHHSDAIITGDAKHANRFMKEIDSATVYHNASTRFTDGEQFGMGAEMGISTDKLHARGPVGLKELTTYKYMIFGQGQIRE